MCMYHNNTHRQNRRCKLAETRRRGRKLHNRLKYATSFCWSACSFFILSAEHRMHNFDNSEKSPTGSFCYGVSLWLIQITFSLDVLCMLDIFHQQNTKIVTHRTCEGMKEWVRLWNQLHAVFLNLHQLCLDQFRSLAERKRCVCHFRVCTHRFCLLLMCTHWFASAFCLGSPRSSFFVSRLLHCRFVYASHKMHVECVCYLLLSWNRIVFLLNCLEELRVFFLFVSLMVRSIFSTGCPTCTTICTIAKLHVWGILNFFFFSLLLLLCALACLYLFMPSTQQAITKVFIKYGIG